jgi:hypothetical protein
MDHILVERRWHSSVLDVPSFRGADCDTHHCLVGTEVRERLSVSKRETKKFDRNRFSVKGQNEEEVRAQRRVNLTHLCSFGEHM